MKNSVLYLTQNDEGGYHAIFTNNHGRKIYLAISKNADICSIIDCHYLDRSVKKRPKKIRSSPFAFADLLGVISTDLDKNFADLKISGSTKVTKAELIERYLGQAKKHILLMLKKQNVMCTIFKNKCHRAIYLKVEVNNGRALISECRYCDARSGNQSISPHGLKSIYFDYSLSALLEVVNTELEGGFTDIAISEQNSISLDRPICGRI